LHARPSYSSGKVAQPVGSPDASQGTMTLCSGTPVLSEDGERSMRDNVSMLVVVVVGKPRIA